LQNLCIFDNYVININSTQSRKKHRVT